MKKLRLFLLTLVALVGINASAETWTVAGSPEILGSSWATGESAGNDMTQVEGTTLWKLTKTYDTPLAAGSYEFKVLKDHEWNTAYPSDNRVLTVDAATNAVTFWYNTDGNSVYATYCYSICGNIWDNWATDKDMTQDATNPNVYTLVVDNFEASVQNYEFKLHANHAWADYQIPANSDNEIWNCTEAGKYKLTFTANVVENTLTLNAEPKWYVCDFNTAIATSNHDFKVAKGWGHIVTENNYDVYGPYYMSYSYYADKGVSGSGCLYAARQYAGDGGGGEVAYDLLVTPTVNGTVTLDVKASISASSSNNAFVEVYAINSDGTRGNLLKTIKEDIAGYNNGSNTEWSTFTLAELTTEQKLGLRLQYVYVDNFNATSVNIPAERKLEVTKVANLEGYDGTGGTTTYFEQQADGTLRVQLQVTLANTGDYDFASGDEGYSLTLASASYTSGTKTYYDDATVAITEALAAGETKTIDVEFSVPFSTGWKYWFVKENISGTTSSSSRYAGVTAYEPKFIFRVAESTSTSSLSSAQAFGLISEETTNHYEIANTGTAPLIIKSITLPEGFTSANMPEIPSEGLSIAKGTTQALDITLPITTMGSFAGNLTIVYLDKDNAEKTYTLAFSGNVLPAGTWAADFNGGNAIAYPAGSIAEGGINSDYAYADGAYNYYIKGRTSNSYASENNKFITPKLHATAGQQLTFDVKGASGSSYYAKVYVSTDRQTWGDPVAYFTYGEKDGAVAIGSSEWVNKAITFDAEGDYYVAFSLYGEFKIDNIIGLTKVDVAHDLYIKSVNWPDASIKTGASQTKPSLDVIPLTDETAESYTVKYVCGETVLAEGTPVALTASANSSKTFSFSWTPSVESTTVYSGTKVVFEFTDGTKIESEAFDLTVTNEPKFHFVKTLPSSKWNEPTDYTTPITFGKTNTADKQSFYVYNWGSAPLTVKSIAVPAGFTATPAEQYIVAAFDENDMSVAAQAVEITFSATEAGEYSGNMVITYVDGTGADATFSIAVSGTKLDPTKFYANFDNPTTSGAVWPAGSVYQGIDASSGNYSAPYNYYLTGTGSFITPKLTATAGEKLLFDAKLYNTSWSEGKVVVYAAATREEVLNAEEGTTRTQLFSVSGQDETNPMTTDYQTFEVPALAGDYYYGFEISGRPYVDEIYGLTVAEVAHDWMIVSSDIPTEAMQNVAATATVNILNLGLAEEAADGYTATLYLDGEAAATAEAVALPMNHKLSDAGTQLSFSFLSSKVGTFPVYVELKAGDYSVITEPVEVTFAEEVFVNDAIEIGSGTTTSYSYAPIDFFNFEQARTSDIVYTAEQLIKYGLKNGDKISTLAFKGTLSSAKTLTKSSLRAWVGLKTGDITYGSPDKSAMIEVTVYNAGDMAFVAGTNMVTINLPETITYDGTSDLRIYLEGGGNSEYVSLYFAYDTNYSNMKWSNSSSMKYNPLLYVTLDAAPATLAGTVKNTDDQGVAGATITLKADNGVEYSGTTAADGSYSFNVIQAGLNFTATVEAEGYLTHQFAYTVDGEPLNETLYKQFGIVGTLPGFDWDNDKVMTQSAEDPSIFTLEIKDVEVEAGTYAFKLRADGKWGFYQQPAGSGDYTDTNNGYDVVDGNYSWNFNTSGTYNFLFTFDWSTHTLTFERPYTLSEEAEGVADLNWVNVTVEREFKAGWNAVVLPFDLSAAEVTEAFGENSELAVYDGDEGTENVTVKFKKIAGEYKYITAGYPYMLWLENPVSGLKFTKNISSTLTTAPGNVFDFVGVYTTTTTADGDYFVQGGEFRKTTNTNTVKPFRAYLRLKASGVRNVSFMIGDDMTTEIEGLTVERDYTNDAIYNLNGQKVQQPTQRGLYIINGKKVMVK